MLTFEPRRALASVVPAAPARAAASADPPEKRALLSERMVRGILLSILVLNLFDAYFTVLFIHQMRVLPEANPLMGFFLSFGMGGIPFVFAKTALVSGGALVLWRRPHDVFTQFGAYLALALYGSTVLHFHLFSLTA